MKEVPLGSVWKTDGDLYLFSQIGMRDFAFIGLSHGNRWTAPIPIPDYFGWVEGKKKRCMVLDEEWNSLTSGCQFEKVENSMVQMIKKKYLKNS